MEGHASWSEDRGVVIAVRRRTAGWPDAVLAMARLVVVGVGLGLLAAFAAALTGLRGFRSRLQHRILLSYFVISFIPIIILIVALFFGYSVIRAGTLATVAAAVDAGEPGQEDVSAQAAEQPREP